MKIRRLRKFDLEGASTVSAISGFFLYRMIMNTVSDGFALLGIVVVVLLEKGKIPLLGGGSTDGLEIFGN